MSMAASICFRSSCLSLLDELTDGVWVEAVQAQPNPRPPFLPFPWGSIVSLSASKKNTFPSKHLSMEQWDATRHHPDLPLCFPFPFSPLIVLGQSFLWCMSNPALDLQKLLRESIFSCDNNICIQVVDAGAYCTCHHYY